MINIVKATNTTDYCFIQHLYSSAPFKHIQELGMARIRKLFTTLLTMGAVTMCGIHDVNMHCANWNGRDPASCQSILRLEEDVEVPCLGARVHQNGRDRGEDPGPLPARCYSPIKSDRTLDWRDPQIYCADCLKARQSAERPCPSDGGGKRKDGDNDDPDDTPKPRQRNRAPTLLKLVKRAKKRPARLL